MLSLLGVFALSPGADNSIRLKNGLDHIVSCQLPLKSSEEGYEEGTFNYGNYMGTLRKLLFALSVSENPVILETLTSILCRESDHVAEDEISYRLARQAQK